MRRSRPVLLFAIAITASLAIFFHRSILFGEVFSPADLLFSVYPWAYDRPMTTPSNVTRSDEVAYHQPLMVTHWERLKRGDLPEWDPFRIAGAPAFFQGLNTGMMFQPLSLPFYLFPADIAVTLYAPLRLSAAAFFMWLYLRSLGLGSTASIGGGLAFAFNGVFLAWLSAPTPTVALFLPLMLWAIDRLVERPELAQAAMLALATAGMLYGAYPPASLVVLFVAGSYVVVWFIRAGLQPSRWAGLKACGTTLILATVLTLGLSTGMLAPMLENLLSSPVAERSMRAVHVPFSNLVTLAVPKFWGSPVDRNWWCPAGGNFPEFVAYPGVTVLLLAGCGATLWREWRVRFFLSITIASAFALYGLPPLTWLGWLPGYQQLNPMRWSIGLCAALSILCAYGLHALESQRSSRKAMVGAVVMLALLCGFIMLALQQRLPAIRVLSLQPYIKAQLYQFALIVGIVAVIIAAIWVSKRMTIFAGVALLLLLSLELIAFGVPLNPTLLRSDYYPVTPSLSFLQKAERGRIAFVEEGGQFLPGDQWSIFGLQTVTGYDFQGDASYQRFMARAAGRPFSNARWDFVGLPDSQQLNLKLLGLLNVTHVVTPPTDTAVRSGGFSTVGEITHGRTIEQTFRATYNGLHRVDLLSATFARTNQGAIRVRVLEHRDAVTHTEVASQTFQADRWPNNDWLPVRFPPQLSSAGRVYSIQVIGQTTMPGKSPTLWSTAQDDYDHGTLLVDGGVLNRDLWFRTFSTAPDRWPGAEPVFAHDLNVYRNTLARPRAWFVTHVERLPRDRQLERLSAADFDHATTALLESSISAEVAEGSTPQVLGSRFPVPGSGFQAHGSSARVLEVEAQDDGLDIIIDAPDGGILVVSERFHPGWRASSDGQPAELHMADDILMAVTVKPGTRRVQLRFRQSGHRWAFVITGVALVAVAVLIAGPGVVQKRRSPLQMRKPGN